MTVRAEIDASKLVKHLDRLSIEAKKRMAGAIYAGALLIEKTAKQKIARGGRTGKIYGNHQASAPGEAPKTDKGNLIRNITTKKESEMVVTVGSRDAAPYGRWLEFGTSRNDYEERPWLQPSFDESLEEIEKKITDAINEVLK